MNRIIYTALLLLTTVSLFSCAKSSSEARTDANDNIDNIEKDSEMHSNSFQIVSLNKTDKEIYRDMVGQYFSIKKGDDFVMFDNQADYSEFCSEMVLRCAVLHEWKCLKHNYTNVWPSADEKISMLEQIPDLINQYQNNKNDISDPVIFEAVDRIFFNIDYDPSNLKLELTDKLYDRQYCKNKTKHLTVLLFKFIPEKGGDIGGTVVTLDGDSLPTGAVFAIVTAGFL